MNYKAIIFDMDGTIIATEAIWEQATHELIAAKGRPLSEIELKQLEYELHGRSLHESCALIKDLCQIPETLEEVIRYKETRAYELYAQGITFIKGFVEFHDKLRDIGLQSAVATNANKKIVEITDKTLNLSQFFGNHLYHMGHVNDQGKPNPAVFLYAAQQLDVAPEQCIVIEDSPHGIRAAKAAGMYCIGINTSQKRERLQQADQIIEGYQELDLHALLVL